MQLKRFTYCVICKHAVTHGGNSQLWNTVYNKRYIGIFNETVFISQVCKILKSIASNT